MTHIHTRLELCAAAALVCLTTEQAQNTLVPRWRLEIVTERKDIEPTTSRTTRAHKPGHLDEFCKWELLRLECDDD